MVRTSGVRPAPPISARLSGSWSHGEGGGKGGRSSPRPVSMVGPIASSCPGQTRSVWRCRNRLRGPDNGPTPQLLTRGEVSVARFGNGGHSRPPPLPTRAGSRSRAGSGAGCDNAPLWPMGGVISGTGCRVFDVGGVSYGISLVWGSVVPKENAFLKT